MKQYYFFCFIVLICIAGRCPGNTMSSSHLCMMEGTSEEEVKFLITEAMRSLENITPQEHQAIATGITSFVEKEIPSNPGSSSYSSRVGSSSSALAREAIVMPSSHMSVAVNSDLESQLRNCHAAKEKAEARVSLLFRLSSGLIHITLTDRKVANFQEYVVMKYKPQAEASNKLTHQLLREVASDYDKNSTSIYQINDINKNSIRLL